MKSSGLKAGLASSRQAGERERRRRPKGGYPVLPVQKLTAPGPRFEFHCYYPRPVPPSIPSPHELTLRQRFVSAPLLERAIDRDGSVGLSIDRLRSPKDENGQTEGRKDGRTDGPLLSPSAHLLYLLPPFLDPLFPFIVVVVGGGGGVRTAIPSSFSPILSEENEDGFLPLPLSPSSLLGLFVTFYPPPPSFSIISWEMTDLAAGGGGRERKEKRSVESKRIEKEGIINVFFFFSLAFLFSVDNVFFVERRVSRFSLSPSSFVARNPGRPASRRR